MSKTKKLLIALMLLIAVLLLPNMVNAAVEYTRNFPSNDGTIELNLTGLELDPTKQYEFALVSTGGNPDADSWNLITTRTANTAKLVLASATPKIVDVLKVADDGQIFVREKDNTEEYVVNRLDVNLKLPYLQSLAYTKGGTFYRVGEKIYGAIGDNAFDPHTYICWKKVTDQNLIEEFLNVKENDLSMSVLEQYLPNCPNEGYSFESDAKYTEKNDGLYLLWVKRTGANCKEVYSCIIHDGLPNATTIEEYLGVTNNAPKIESVKAEGGSLDYVTSNIFEYHAKPNNEIKINIKFNQAIVKNTAPTLTIKFGTGSNVELTTCEAASNILTYKYTIKEGDLGTLQIVSLSGGNVTNNEGTAAVLTLPELSGYSVVAVEGNVTQEEPTETVDTTTYISFPFIIYNGKGSVDLKSGVNIENYKMYYQFVEISEEVYNKITDLQDKYKNGEITYEEYFVQYNSIVTKYNDKNWIETKDGSFKRDLNEFTGTKKFALWVKLEMEDKTVYESQIYKMNGSGAATNDVNPTDKTDKDTTKDNTTAKDKLPNTGRVLLFWVIGIVAVSGIVAHIRYKKLYM